MNLSLLCVICILSIQLGQIAAADNASRRQIGVGRKHQGAAAADSDDDDETRSGLQGGRTFRLSRSRARLPVINIEQENIREDSDVLSPDRGRARKGVRKAKRKTAKKKGIKNPQGQLKQQILSTPVEAAPVPIVKVSDWIRYSI